MATIKDVAKLSGVSTATVSFVLNGLGTEKKISETTQKKILEAARELNYQPNMMAKRLRTSNNKQYTIGIYWAFDYRAYSLARFLLGIQEEILKKQYPIDIVICPYENDKLYEKKDLFNFSSYNAAIIATTSPADMEYLKKHTPSMPVVLFNRTLDDYFSVGIDNEGAGKKAALHFINEGISNIASILSNDIYLAGDQRYNGFVEALKSHNITISEENLIITNNDIQGGIKAAEEILKLENPPKAIYCGTDYISHGLVHAFNKKGVKIPEDVQIITVGYNNIEYSLYNDSAILYIDVPIEKMAVESFKLIYDILEGNENKPRSIIIDTDLILQK